MDRCGQDPGRHHLWCHRWLLAAAVRADPHRFGSDVPHCAGKAKFIMNSDIMKECFACKPIWVVIRVLAVIFVWLTYLGVGEGRCGSRRYDHGGGQGGFVGPAFATTTRSGRWSHGSAVHHAATTPRLP